FDNICYVKYLVSQSQITRGEREPTPTRRSSVVAIRLPRPHQPAPPPLPERQLVEPALGFVILNELPLLRAEAGTVRQPAAIDGHHPMPLVQQFVIDDEVDDLGGHPGVIQ